jgi:hypothetical protein
MRVILIPLVLIAFAASAEASLVRRLGGLACPDGQLDTGRTTNVDVDGNRVIVVCHALQSCPNSLQSEAWNP